MRAWIGVALFAWGVTACAPARPESEVGAQSERPGHQIDLYLSPNSSAFRGRASLRLSSQLPTRSVTLDLHADRLLDVAVEQRGAPIAVREAKLLTYQSDTDLQIRLRDPVGPGPFRVTVDYQGRIQWQAPGRPPRTAGPLPDTDFGILGTFYAGRPYLFTHLEPYGARNVLPCHDEPGQRALFSLSITAPKRYQVVGNTPVERVVAAGGDYRHEFRTTPPLPTYLLAFAVGQFSALEGRPRLLTVQRPPADEAERERWWNGQRAWQRTAERELRALEDYLGQDYPFEKLDLLMLPDYRLGQENPGLITLELSWFDPTKLDSALGRGVLSHELSHQWFGDAVGIDGWADLWIKEGLATWYEWSRGPAASADGLPSRLRVRHWEWLERGAGRSVRTPGPFYDALSYDKAGAVFSMLEGWVGRERWRGALRQLVRQHQWQALGLEELGRSLEQGTGVPGLSAVLESYVENPGVPGVSLSTECDESGVAVTLRQHSQSGQGPFAVPVCFELGGPGSGEIARHCHLLRDAAETIQLDARPCPNWVLPNSEARGYYVSQLSSEQADGLVAVAAELSPAERLDVLESIFTLVLNRELPVDVFLRAAETMPLDEPMPGLVLNRIQALFCLVGTKRNTSSQRRLGRLAARIVEASRQRREAGHPKDVCSAAGAQPALRRGSSCVQRTPRAPEPFGRLAAARCELLRALEPDLERWLGDHRPEPAP